MVAGVRSRVRQGDKGAGGSRVGAQQRAGASVLVVRWNFPPTSVVVGRLCSRLQRYGVSKDSEQLTWLSSLNYITTRQGSC